MTSHTISFYCLGGVCTPSTPDEVINTGDTLMFVNNISSGPVTLTNFSADLFQSGDTSIKLKALGSNSQVISPGAPSESYSYTISCDVCPAGDGQDQGTIHVDK